MLDTPIMSLLERSLDYSSTQQAAISANLSNVNTPGYERKDASFATVLAQATDGATDQSAPLPGLINQPGHIPIDGAYTSPTGGVPVVTDTSGEMRIDGNNVDVDTEMSKLAENQIYYQAVSQFMGGQLSNLKYVIGGG